MIEEHYKNNFDSLVKKYSRSVDTVEDAEDIVQEAYVRALKYYHTYDGSKSFDAWFNTVVKNAYVDFSKDTHGIVHDVDPDDLVGPSVEVSLFVKPNIIEYLKSMKEHHREVINLHFRMGYSPKEISQVSDLTLTNINTIISRFKIKLKEGV